MDDIRIRLADPQGQLLEEIADKRMTRRQVALTYRLALLDQDRVDWPAVNGAIVARWSLSALDWIKALAWKAEAPASSGPAAAPFETGAPFRSAAEADWDGSRDG